MGDRKQKRGRIGKLAAYRMKQAGYTNGEIAKELGIPKEKVQSRILLGERLASINNENGDDK